MTPDVAEPLNASRENAPPRRDRVRGRELRRSLFLVNLAWAFGSVWATATSGAPITEFARRLGATNFQFGILSALPFVASLASMPASILIDRTGSRRKIFLISLYAQRLMWFPIGLIPLWLVHRYGDAAKPLAMIQLLLMIFFMQACNAVGGPAWTAWMADLVPVRIRGAYFSARRQLGIITGIPAAILTGAVLDYVSRAHGGSSQCMLGVCAAIFAVSAVFGVLDILQFQFVRDVGVAPRRQPLLATFAKPLRDRSFLWFGGFVGLLTFAVSFMGQFVTLYLIEQVHAGNTQTQLIVLVAPLLAQLLILPLWGVAADRMGKKPTAAVAALGLVPVGLGWCFMTSGSVWLGYLLSALGGMLWAGVDVSNFNLVLEMSATDDPADPDAGGAGFVAVNSVIVNVAGCLGGLSSGLIAESMKAWHWTPLAGFKPFSFYDVLFALSGLLRLLAVAVFLPHIVEPAAKPTREAVRFMASNIYNNLFSMVQQPLRMIGVRPEEDR